MNYLNLGCGSHYSTNEEWINLDFVSSGNAVKEHNLLNGIPFDNNTFDLVYHSHVLEHFSKIDGEKFISECLRVLKPGGTLRIAIPDLERIAKEYIKWLELGMQDQNNDLIKSNYDWMLLEMYDQTVRNKTGGDMGNYLFKDTIMNEEFVFERIGEEGKGLRNLFLSCRNKPQSINSNKKKYYFLFKSKLKDYLKNYLLHKLKIDLHAYKIGSFRLGGEIHQWMYDRYSITNLLRSKNADKIIITDAFTSYIDNWSLYELDGKYPVVRKPDSLFIEAIK